MPNFSFKRSLGKLNTVFMWIARHQWHINFFLLVGICLWLYLVFERYSLLWSDELAQLERTIENISYTKLSTEELDDVYDAYESKRAYVVDVPDNVDEVF